MKLEIKTTKIRKGKYLVERADGRNFIVLKCSVVDGWAVEAQDTYDVDGAPTLAFAKFAISQGWLKSTKLKLGESA